MVIKKSSLYGNRKYSEVGVLESNYNTSWKEPPADSFVKSLNGNLLIKTVRMPREKRES